MPPIDLKLPGHLDAINPYPWESGSIIPNWLLAQRRPSPGAKLLYGRILRYCNKEGFCWPSQDTLSSDLGVSKRTVQRYVEELCELDLLYVYNRSGDRTSCVYVLLRHAWQEGNDGTPEIPVNPSSDVVGGDIKGCAAARDLDSSNPAQTRAKRNKNRVRISKDQATDLSPGQATTCPRQQKQQLSLKSGQLDVGAGDRSVAPPTTDLSPPPPSLLLSEDLNLKGEGGSPPHDTDHDRIEQYVLSVYDEEYIRAHGSHYVPTKRDAVVAREVYQAAIDLGRKVGKDDAVQRIIRHWCRRLARATGYAEQKSHGFWLMESQRTDFGLPRFEEPKAAEPEAEVVYSTPEEFEQRMAAVMAVLQGD